MELHSQTILRSLIEERAPWFFSRSPGLAMARSILRPLLSYDRTLATLERLRPLDGEEIFSVMGRQLAQHVHTHNLRKLPASGPCLIVCNHPTGIADGIILHEALAQVRPDMYFFANRDVLRVFPQLDSKIAPVEWRPEKRSHQSMREVMEFVRKAVAAERVGIIFPSGRLAKRRGFTLHERPWMASAAMLARRFHLPVVPVNIAARNSALFYLLDLLHPTLRDITLFHETLNKDRFRFDITIGDAIPADSLTSNFGDAIAQLKTACESLAPRMTGSTAPTLTPPWELGLRNSRKVRPLGR